MWIWIRGESVSTGSVEHLCQFEAWSVCQVEAWSVCQFEEQMFFFLYRHLMICWLLNISGDENDTPALRKTGSRNLTGPKTLPTIWHTYMKLVTKYQISAINSGWKKCDKKAHSSSCYTLINNKITNIIPSQIWWPLFDVDNSLRVWLLTWIL
jgi:hypothetical protein